MNNFRYPQIVLDAWALHEAFRKMGFRADDIFFVVSGNGRAPESGLWVFVVLRAQGLEFSIHVAPVGDADPEAKKTMAAWQKFLAELPSLPHGFLHRVYSERFLQRDPGPADLAHALLAKGFAHFAVVRDVIDVNGAAPGDTNIFFDTAIRAAEILGIVTEAETTRFYAWRRETARAREKKSDLISLELRARDLGLRLVPIKKPKPPKKKKKR